MPGGKLAADSHHGRNRPCRGNLSGADAQQHGHGWGHVMGHTYESSSCMERLRHLRRGQRCVHHSTDTQPAVCPDLRGLRYPWGSPALLTGRCPLPARPCNEIRSPPTLWLCQLQAQAVLGDHVNLACMLLLWVRSWKEALGLRTEQLEVSCLTCVRTPSREGTPDKTCFLEVSLDCSCRHSSLIRQEEPRALTLGLTHKIFREATATTLNSLAASTLANSPAPRLGLPTLSAPSTTVSSVTSSHTKKLREL